MVEEVVFESAPIFAKLRRRPPRLKRSGELLQQELVLLVIAK
jgi:hypothetical protein